MTIPRLVFYPQRYAYLAKAAGHKYKSRKRVGGKWVYEYDDPAKGTNSRQLSLDIGDSRGHDGGMENVKNDSITPGNGMSFNAVMAGNAVSDADILKFAYAIANYDIQIGYDGVTAENAEQYRATLAALNTRLSEIRAAKSKPSPNADVGAVFEAARLEEAADSLEDRGRYSDAAKMRGRARALREGVAS